MLPSLTHEPTNQRTLTLKRLSTGHTNIPTPTPQHPNTPTPQHPNPNTSTPQHPNTSTPQHFNTCALPSFLPLRLRLPYQFKIHILLRDIRIISLPHRG